MKQGGSVLVIGIALLTTMITSSFALTGSAELSYVKAAASYSYPRYSGQDIMVPLGRKSTVGDSYTLSVEAPQRGLYELWFTYRNAMGQILPSEISLTVDGAVPFSEARRIKLESLWMQNPVFDVDRYGNEMPSMPIQSGEPQEKPVEDSSYRISEPLLFELAAGIHEIGITVSDGSFELISAALKAPLSYAAYTAGDASGSFLQIVEGERFALANASSVHAAGEYMPEISPYDAKLRLLNFVDGASFGKAGLRIDWEITVPSTGYYKLAFAARQNAKTGFPVFADIAIDGVIPSAEAKQVVFPYASKFVNFTVKTKSGEDQVFRLDAGKHRLSVTINGDPLLPVYEGIDKLLAEINGLSTEIMRLTGGVSADRYRDYALEDYIPGLEGILLAWADEAAAMLNETMKYSRGISSAFASLRVCETTLRRLAKKPEDLPVRLYELSRGPSSVTRYLAAMLTDMDRNELSIDKVFVYQSGASLPKQAGFFTVFTESVKRFFLSFIRTEYTAGTGASDSLQVWMARPRQYVELLQNLIDTGFTPETGIKVDLSIMPDQSKLALAAASGTAPDAALSVGYVLPSYLNIRGALLDVKRFRNFEEVASRFPEGLFIPYIMEGGVYAIPETINFWVTFYRRDIFEALSLPVPSSLDEVKAILPELQRRSMNFYYPTAGMIGMKVFPGTMPYIAQSGGGFFGKSIGHTTLDSEKSLAGFKVLTDLFTVYDIPVEVPAPGFYQEFRSGSMPIGVADVGTYNLLMNSAPELDGLWDLALFPGLKNENGEVTRYTTGGAESDMIFASTKKPDEAWAFLEWWSRSGTQAEFGSTLQSLYGGAYLWNTANKEAFAQLPIPAAHKQVILEQCNWMIEVPWVPGTYMVERELSNAYNSVVIDGVTIRRAMDTAVKRIDREVFRKLEEFGYQDFPTPHQSVLWEKQ